MLRPAGYHEVAPPADLADLVECFWTASGSPPGRYRVLPDGCMDIVFDFSSGAAVVGAMRQARIVVAARQPDLLGVRFRPGGLPACFRLEAAPLTDDRVDLAFVWPEARSVWNRLGEAAPAARLAMLVHHLRRLRRSSPDALVRHCVERIEASGGRLRMAVLERATATNARQIERRFVAHVGLSAKRFSRVVRFKRAMSALRRGRADWAGLAVDCGYADQPHLVREFKEFSGLTPDALVGNLQDGPEPRA